MRTQEESTHQRTMIVSHYPGEFKCIIGGCSISSGEWQKLPRSHVRLNGGWRQPALWGTRLRVNQFLPLGLQRHSLQEMA